jgi:3D-(3,5/4)-trihydroxycyclohexane-1,2-dione acylhydrolase (decyclizing)
MCVGLGQALQEDPGHLAYTRGGTSRAWLTRRSATQSRTNRSRIIACTSSIGPGRVNMVTAALTATINNVPLLLFPSDSFATRQPDPVLQQLECPESLSTTASDCFKPVASYWDRIARPEQLMPAMVNAMRVLTDPANCGTAVISMPQDVEGESYDYPEYFFQKRIHHIPRHVADDYEIEQAVDDQEAKKPMLISGGGVRYSEAGQIVMDFAKEFNIPVAQTQAGHSALPDSFELCGRRNRSHGKLRGKCAVQGLRPRQSEWERDSTILSPAPSGFCSRIPDIKVLNQHIEYHAQKLDACSCVGDAKVTLEAIYEKLKETGYRSAYTRRDRRSGAHGS